MSERVEGTVNHITVRLTVRQPTTDDPDGTVAVILCDPMQEGDLYEFALSARHGWGAARYGDGDQWWGIADETHAEEFIAWLGVKVQALLDAPQKNTDPATGADESQ